MVYNNLPANWKLDRDMNTTFEFNLDRFAQYAEHIACLQMA